MAAIVWTEDLEERLIALVEKRPALWNFTLQCYSNRNSQDKLWRQIERELNLTGKEVRRKWGNLHTAYNRYQRPVLLGSSSEPRPWRRQWLTSRMSFIERHTKKKESQSNLTQKELCDTATHTAVAPKEAGDKHVRGVSQILDGLASSAQRQDETDYISLCCKRLEHQMRMIPPQQLVQFEFELECLLYRFLNTAVPCT